MLLVFPVARENDDRETIDALDHFPGMEMSLFAFIYAACIIFIGAWLTGVTSFGGNLFAVPMLTLVMSAREAIVYACLAGIPIMLSLVLIYRKDLVWKEIGILGLSGMLGCPGGVWVLARADAGFLMALAGICITLFLIWQYFIDKMRKVENKISLAWAVPLGFLSGVLTGAVGIGGPPIVAYAYLRKWGKETSIGSLNAAVSITLATLLPGFWQNNLVGPTMAADALWGAIFAVLGVIASIPVVNHINTELFRKFLLAMLAASALMLFARGLMS